MTFTIEIMEETSDFIQFYQFKDFMN